MDPRQGEEEAEQPLDHRGDVAGEHAEGEQAPSPRHRLRDRRAYWGATMRQMGLVCSLVLSVISGGFRMDWDPDMGPAPPAFLRNHPSAFAEAAFVMDAITTGIAARTMRVCSRDALICILPLGVAFNSAMKRRLIWDGRHVNRHLRKRPFRMETLQREGRALFERSHFGGTLDISSAYHHVDMAPEAAPYLGFEWDGSFYCFEVLPFGLSSAPWLFTTIMGHSVNFLRFEGNDLMAYLDDVIFASGSARGAVDSAQRMLRTLREFGWLVHPTKCVGTSAAEHAFVALGTLVDLATQTYAVPAATLARILHGVTALLTGPPSVGVRSVARLKGLVASTWLSTGSATRVRTRAMDSVIATRAGALARRERRNSWNAAVLLTAGCRAELLWWRANLHRISGCPIRDTPLGSPFDSTTESDASDTGVGAITFVDGAAAAASTLVGALLALAPAGLTRRMVRRQARRGIQFMAALPQHLLAASSTLRELYGVDLAISALAHLLRGGRHKVVMDNLGCVFIMGGCVPSFATGGRSWGEFVSGGSPNQDLQRLAVHMLDLQIEHGFSLTFVWVPRDLNVRADFLSHVSEMRHHHYSLLEEWFAYLDGLWGPHTIDRFASADNRQPLCAPWSGRFCSQFFHPDAEWVDALSLSWAGENNWLFPPTHLVGSAVAHLRACGASATLICPHAAWASWWPALRCGPGWARDVRQVVTLGPARAVLSVSKHDLRLFGDGAVIAVRFGRS
jgi:hypothetical protein